jgi:hypothetical protein
MFFLIRFTIVFGVVSLLPIVSNAQLSGNNSYEFLKIPTSARAASLGGNVIASGDTDFNLTFTNPALLSDTMDNHMAFNYINYFTDINGGYLAYSKNIKRNNTLGFGLHYMDYGKIKQADEFGNVNGTFGANDMSINVSYARVLKDSNATIGVTSKTIYSNLYNYTSWASGLDIGGQYTFPKYKLTVAALLQNIGYSWKGYTSQTKESLPFKTQLGLYKQLKHAPLKLYVTYQDVERWNIVGSLPYRDTTKKSSAFAENFKKFGNNLMLHFTLGGELTLAKVLYVRVGYNYQRRRELMVEPRKGLSGFAFGFGLRMNKFNVSYSRAVYSIAGVSNNFSLSVNLNSFYKKKMIN